MHALLMIVLLALPATFNGATWQEGGGCAGLADDLTYAVCAVVDVPAGVAPSSTGRAIFSAASEASSTAYVTMGFADNVLRPSITHRTGSGFYKAEASSTLVGLHTVMGVADGQSIRLFVDGLEVGSASLAGAAPATRELCTYGALRRDGWPDRVPDSFWVGEIRSVWVWDHPASVAEATSIGCTTGPMTDPCTAPPRYGVEQGRAECSESVTTNCTLPCVFDRQGILGGCSEEMSWDPAEGAQWYLVYRAQLEPPGSSWEVGSTRFRPAFEDPIDGPIPAWSPTQWIPAWDSPSIVVGRLYEYRVKSCKADDEGDEICSTEFSNPVHYRAACHDCDGGEPNLCPDMVP